MKYIIPIINIIVIIAIGVYTYYQQKSYGEFESIALLATQSIDKEEKSLEERKAYIEWKDKWCL